MHKPFLCDLVDTVVDVMGAAFPELRKNPQHVKAIIREEEGSFERTLDRGIALFEEAADYASKEHRGEIRGADAFKLHDTYGFPIDLTQVMADEKGLRVDIGEYERLMEEARERARAHGEVYDDQLADQIDKATNDAKARTDDSAKYSSELECESRITSIASNAPLFDTAPVPAGHNISFTVEKTCFYVESGGQVSDVGEVITDTGRIEVTNVVRRTAMLSGSPIEVIVHSGKVVEGKIDAGPCTLRVSQKRRDTMSNHTATHLMNWALREVLGDHVQQKGSLVDPEKTRFDFSHPKALSPAEIERVEKLVNDRIKQNLPVDYQHVPQQDALKINGLRAVFGEKYPDVVRVMSIGPKVDELLANPDNPEWRKYSIEFCGGTHLRQTADIEHFVITAEEAVAKGIRRIVAVTGPTAKIVEEAGAALLLEAEELKQGPPEDVPAGLAQLQTALSAAQLPMRHRARIQALLGELQQIVKQQHKAEAADAAGVVNAKIDELLQAAEKVGDATVVVAEMPDVPVEQLKGGADRIKQTCKSAAILFGVRQEGAEGPGDQGAKGPRGQGTQGPRDQGAQGPREGEAPAEPQRAAQAGKAILLAAMSDDLIKRGLKAGDLVKAVAPLVKGGGGGPPTMAQAGGKAPEKLDEALAAGKAWIHERLSK